MIFILRSEEVDQRWDQYVIWGTSPNSVKLTCLVCYIVLRNNTGSSEIFVVVFCDIDALIITQPIEKGKRNHYPSLEKVF